jgi:hypothetical protein
MFKLWSEIKKEANMELSPNFGFRSWDDLSKDDKYRIWKYLEWYFFEKDESTKDFFYEDKKCNYKFLGDHGEAEKKIERIIDSVTYLNLKHKSKSYAYHFLEDKKFNSACRDFYEIFSTQSENVVLELFSLYAKLIILERKQNELEREEGEIDNEFNKRVSKWKWEIFDDFAENLNELFIEFGVKYYLTRDGFAPRQDSKIMLEIFDPVLVCLSDKKWEETNKLLSDAFIEYRKNTPQGYSNCVTNTVSAVQSFLQILVINNTGKGDISKLILTASKNNLIPNDFFTQNIFKNIESIFAKERQEIGIAHPKKEYANEKNARTILNLAMIFLQHCLQY